MYGLDTLLRENSLLILSQYKSLRAPNTPPPLPKKRKKIRTQHLVSDEITNLRTQVLLFSFVTFGESSLRRTNLMIIHYLSLEFKRTCLKRKSPIAIA